MEAWQTSIELAKEVYQLTSTYPSGEQFGLVAQMRRSAVSVASNIAEGAARSGNKEFLHFLYVTVGSLSELDTQIEISRLVAMADDSHLAAVQDHVRTVRMLLSGLIRSLKRDSM